MDDAKIVSFFGHQQLGNVIFFNHIKCLQLLKHLCQYFLDAYSS